MKRDFAIAEDWRPFEIHPDTPRQGVRWADYFPGMNPKAFFRQLDGRGRTMGLRFGPQPLMSNSREALQAGEFAKAHGRYDAYHEAVFRAYFTDCRDIGDRKVILELAREVGLDARQLETALDARTFKPRLDETTRIARAQGISAAPTFLIEGVETISGAQPIETFRAALQAAGSAPQTAGTAFGVTKNGRRPPSRNL